MTEIAAAPVLVSQLEAARLLSVERTTIWRMCRRFQLDTVHIGRRSLITRASIEVFVAAQVNRTSWVGPDQRQPS